MEIAKKLADEIGVRYGGSEKEEQTTRFVYQYLQNKGLEVEQQKIQVLGCIFYKAGPVRWFH